MVSVQRVCNFHNCRVLHPNYYIYFESKKNLKLTVKQIPDDHRQCVF